MINYPCDNHGLFSIFICLNDKVMFLNLFEDTTLQILKNKAQKVTFSIISTQLGYFLSVSSQITFALAMVSWSQHSPQTVRSDASLFNASLLEFFLCLTTYSHLA